MTTAMSTAARSTTARWPGWPASPASLGFWDFVLPTATPLPAMPNDMGFWDRLR